MDTPGTILRREREARGIPLKEIASITRIPVSALRHLEEDRFDQFPAEVFAKGFLRNYARELQISVDDVMLAYQALKHHQHRQDVGLVAEIRKREVIATPSIPSVPSVTAATPSAPAASATPRRARRVRSERRDEAPVTPLVLAAPEIDRDASAASVDSSQRTFRFAYLIVFLVVVTSLGLSVLFTGTGEAEENGRRRARPVLDDDADKSNRWLMSNQRLTTTQSNSSRTAEVDTTAAGSIATPALPVAPIDTAAVPNDAVDSGSATDRWNRPAFPQDDHE